MAAADLFYTPGEIIRSFGPGGGGGGGGGTPITGAASTIVTLDLPISRAVVSDVAGKIAVSPVTAVELSYLASASSNIQTQINNVHIRPYLAITSAYVITLADFAIDCTSGTFTVTLPTPIGNQGRIFSIKNSGAGIITVVSNSAELIDDVVSYNIQPRYKAITLMSTGTSWNII